MHYAMFLKSSLNDNPVDYTYARGNSDYGQATRFRIGDNTLLWGLELAVMEMREGAQARVEKQHVTSSSYIQQLHLVVTSGSYI